MVMIKVNGLSTGFLLAATVSASPLLPVLKSDKPIRLLLGLVLLLPGLWSTGADILVITVH
jgi:hypothetical protein